MQRPRLKPVFAPMVIGPEVLSLGFPRTPGSATIPDPDGGVRAVLNLLDGTRDVAALTRDLVGRCEPAAVSKLLQALSAEGFLEDAALVPPADLTEVELRRYDRNGEFFSYFTDRGAAGDPATRFSPQLALKQATVVILGVGGLGSHVALHLAALGVGRLHLVDFDSVEESNLNRQLLFTEADIGQLKVSVAARRLAAVNPFVDVRATASSVRSVDDAAGWLMSGDLMICAADRPRVDLDLWINSASIECGRPWMRGASVGLTAVLDLFVPGRTACAECRLQPSGGELSVDQLFLDQLRSRTDVAASPCISPVAGLLGSLAALEAMKFLTGVARTPLLDNQIVVDLPHAEVHHLPDPPHELCRACAGRREPGGRRRVDAEAHC